MADTQFCFDMATFLPETLPLISKPYDGQTCDTNITLSILTSVAGYSELEIDHLRSALGLHHAPPPDYNAYSVSLSTAADDVG